MPETKNADVPAVINKRVERFNSFMKQAELVMADMKEQKYLNQQIEAKVNTCEARILAAKAELLELEEKIRQKKIEVGGSFNAIRDDLTKREVALNARVAEVEVRERTAAEKLKKADEMIDKAEKAIDSRNDSERLAQEQKASEQKKQARLSAQREQNKSKDAEEAVA